MELPSNDYQRRVIESHKKYIPFYTSDGFKVIDLDPKIFNCIVKMYKTVSQWEIERKDLEDLEERSAITGNSWPVVMVTTNGSSYYQRLLNCFLPMFQEWVKKPLIPVIAYGPRKYLSSAVLLDHVDLFRTHRISGSLTIDFDLNCPWPLIVTHNNQYYEFNLKPGQMLMYEGARLPHCRPYPLDGKFYINMYFHYFLAEEVE